MSLLGNVRARAHRRMWRRWPRARTGRATVPARTATTSAGRRRRAIGSRASSPIWSASAAQLKAFPRCTGSSACNVMWLQEKNGKTYADKQVKMDLRGAVLSYQAAMRFANSYATTPYIRRVCGCGCASAAPDTRACAGRRLSGSCRSRLGRRAPKEAEQVLPGANATLLYAAPRSASQCSLRLDTSPLVPSGVAAFALRAALPCQSYDSTKSYTSTYDSLTTVIPLAVVLRLYE